VSVIELKRLIRMTEPETLDGKNLEKFNRESGDFTYH